MHDVMQSGLLLAQQPGIQQNLFTPLPGWFIAFLASYGFLIFFRSWGVRLAPADNPWLDRVADLMVLLSAASIVASISTWPLIQSTTQITQGWARQADSQNWQVLGLNIGSTVVAIAALVILGLAYEKFETNLLLVMFGVSAQTASIFAPWINVAMIGWINYPIRYFWNALMFLLNFIPSIQFNVA